MWITKHLKTKGSQKYQTPMAINPFVDLPAHIIGMTAAYLPAMDVLNFLSCCTQFNKVCIL